jgi:hypothetical protein
MEIDVVLASLAILLGAQLSYVADEIFSITPRLATWFGRFFD